MTSPTINAVSVVFIRSLQIEPDQFCGRSYMGHSESVNHDLASKVTWPTAASCPAAVPPLSGRKIGKEHTKHKRHKRDRQALVPFVLFVFLPDSAIESYESPIGGLPTDPCCSPCTTIPS